jgi:ubiquitin-protein ligase
MLARRAALNKSTSTVKPVLQVLDRDKLQEKIREELACCSSKDLYIDHVSLFKNELEQKVAPDNAGSLIYDEEVAQMRSIVKNQVLKIHTEQIFPDIDDVLRFQVVITAVTIPKSQQLREEQCFETLETKNAITLSTYTVTAAGIAIFNNQYTFDVDIPLQYPSTVPSVVLRRITTDGSENNNKKEQVCIVLQTLSNVQSMNELMHYLTNIVKEIEEEYIRSETRAMAHHRFAEIQERRKKEMESIGEEKCVIMDYDTYIEEGSIISKSDTGVIRRGKFKAKPPKLEEDVAKREIAIKTFLFKKDESELPQLHFEMNVLCSLKHDKLVRCLAYSVLREKLYLKMIMELIPEDNLHDMIHKKHKDKLKQAEIVKHLRIATVLKRLALDVAEGLAYLHSKNILHRNLKSTYVLVDTTEWSAKLCIDVKHCYYLQEGETQTPESVKSVGLPQYMSPEEFEEGTKQSNKVDVYAFGVFLCELYTQKKPWREVQSTKIREKVLAGERPFIADSVPKAVQDLIQECWQQDPNTRPSMIQVINKLQQL